MLLRASFEIIRLIFMFYGFHVVCIFMCQWNYKQAYRALHTQFPMKFKNTTCIQFNSAKKCGTTLPGTREINLNLGEKVEWRDKQQICGMKYNLYSCLLTNVIEDIVVALNSQSDNLIKEVHLFNCTMSYWEVEESIVHVWRSWIWNDITRLPQINIEQYW